MIKGFISRFLVMSFFVGGMTLVMQMNAMEVRLRPEGQPKTKNIPTSSIVKYGAVSGICGVVGWKFLVPGAIRWVSKTDITHAKLNLISGTILCSLAGVFGWKCIRNLVQKFCTSHKKPIEYVLTVPGLQIKQTGK